MRSTPPVKQRGTLCRKFARNRTGCVGISFETRRRASGLVRHFFSALTGPAGQPGKQKQFCLETLGRQEAWRRALHARAAYVRRMEQERQGRAGAPTTPTRKMPAGNPDAGSHRTSKSQKQFRPAISQT